MNKDMRQFFAISLGLKDAIGKKVKATHPYAFRSGETAEVVGWGINSENKRPLLFIRFEDGECDYIAAPDMDLSQSGYAFVD